MIYFFLITDINISFTQDITNIRLILSWCGYYFSYVFMILLWQTVNILLTWQKIYFSYIKDWCCIYVWLVFMEMLIFGKFLVEVLFEGPAPRNRTNLVWYVHCLMECQQQEQTVQWYSVKSSKAKVAFYRSLGMGDKRSLFVNCSISWDGKFPGAIERVDSC